MTNTKRWKIALVVLCVLLALSLATLGVLAFTQTFAEQAPDVSKKYGALVLGDNTAKYSVTEVGTSSRGEWNYNRELNLWTSTINTEESLSLTATVAQDSPEDSVLAFEYLVEYNRDATDYPDYYGDSWTQEKSYISVEVKPKDGGDTQTYKAGDAVWHDDFNIMTVPVQAGDTVVISAINQHKNAWDGSTNYLIHGLALPGKETNRTITVNTGSNGTVTATDSVNAGVEFAGNVQEGVTTFSVPLGASVTLTPHANENFSFSDWRQSEETVSYEEILHVDSVQTDVEYTAVFAQDGGVDLSAVGKYGAQWQQESENSFYIHTCDDPTAPDANVGKTGSDFTDSVSMFYYVQGMQEVSFDWWCYFAPRQGNTTTGTIDESTTWSKPGMASLLNFYVYVDGFEYHLSLTTTSVVENKQYNGKTAPSSNSEVEETTSLKLRIQSEGIHKIEFKLDFVSSFRNEESTQFTFIDVAAGISNLTTEPIEQPQSSDTTYTVHKLSDDENVNQWVQQGDDSGYKIEATKNVANFASDLDIDFVGDKNISFDWEMSNAARSNFIVFVDGVPTSLIGKSGTNITGKYNQLVTGNGYGEKHHRVTIRGRYILLNNNHITITNLSVTDMESTEGNVRLDDCGSSKGEDRTYIKWKTEDGAYRFDGQEGIDAITQNGGYNADYNMAMSQLSLYYEFDGVGELNFEFWLWGAMKSSTSFRLIYLYVYVDGQIAWQRGGGIEDGYIYFYGDGEKQQCGKNGNWNPKEAVHCKAQGVQLDFDKNYSSVPQLPDGADTFAQASVSVTESGYHEVEFRFGADYRGQSSNYANTDFAIKNISFTPAQTHTVTVADYDARLGTFYLATKADEGAEFGDPEALAPGQVVTVLADSYVKLNFVEATATKDVIVNSSVASNRLVRTKFVGFDANGYQDSDSAEFKLEGNVTVTPHFNQTAPQPYLWSQINITDGATGDAILAQSNTVIRLPYGKSFDFRIFARGYENDTEKNFSISMNGVTNSFQAVKGNEGVIVPPEGLDTDNLFVMVESSVQENLRIDITYTREGYSDCTFTILAEFFLDDEVNAPGDDSEHSSVFNNLFSEQSEAGAYAYFATDTWSPSPEFTQDGMGIAFTSVSGRDGYQGNHPGIAVASDKNNYTYYGFMYFSVQSGKTGLLSIDVRLDGGATSAESLAFVKLGLITQQDAKQSSSEAVGAGGFSSVSVLKATQSGAETDNITNSAVSARAIGDGWWRISVLTGDYHTVVLQYSVNEAYVRDTQLVLRNLTFVCAEGKDDLHLTFKTSSIDDGVQVAATNNTKDGAALTANQANTVSFGDNVVFTATVPEGFVLYGWTVAGTEVDDETFYSPLNDKDTKLSYVVTQDTTVTAWIDRKDAYALRVGGSFFNAEKLDEAFAKAEQSKAHKSVVALKDFEISGDHTIPSGVTLLIPYGANGRLTDTGRPNKPDLGWTQNASGDLAWDDEPQYKYLTVTLDVGAKLTINGTLGLGGVVNYTSGQCMQGHTSGAYSQLVNNGEIVVENKGAMDVYGRVTGEGKIQVLSGGKLFQPFLILDFTGGTNTLSMFSGGQTPFKRYAMINIECPITVNYGGQLLGHASLWVETMSLLASLDQPFISDTETKDGTGNDTFVMLHKGASVTLDYDAPVKELGNASSYNGTKGIGKTTMVFSGGATFSYMRFSAMGITIFTNSVVFAIPYNFDVQLTGNTAQYDTVTAFNLLPGATLHVCEGATLTINKDAYVFDGLNVLVKLANKWYPAADELQEGGYSTNANLIVDGTLVLKDNITFAGTIQTSGSSGKVVIGNNVTLNAKAVEGVKGSAYYAEYELKTRLYDKAHDGGVIAYPEAGKTYLAASDAQWTLPSAQVTDSSSGNIGSTREAAVNGSWMVDHSGAHIFNWNPVEGEHDGLDAENPFKTLTRQCTELGCNEQEHKDLLYVPDSLGELTYNGKDVADADLQGLFEEMFVEVSATAQFSGYSAHNAQTAAYNVTVSLVNGYWLVGSEYQANAQLSFKVNPKPITVKANDQSAAYGEEHTLDPKGFTVLDDGLCANDVLSLKLQFQGAQPHDVGDYTIEIADYDGNTNYKITAQTGTYKVTQRAITVVLSAEARDYNGSEPSVSEIKSALKQGNLPYDDQLKNIITISFTEAVSKDAGSYPFTAALTETGKKNYTLTVECGSYVINKKSVTVRATDLTSVFGEDIQKLKYTVEGLVGQETIDEFIAISTDATNTSPVGNSYTITVTWKDESRPQNYEVKFQNGHYTITNAKFSNITFSETTVTFDGKVHKPKMDNAPEGATVEYTLNKAPFDGAKDAGTYQLTATVKLDNYEDSQPYSVTFTISKLEITVALTSVTRPYNGKAPAAEELQATADGKTALDTGDNLADIVTISFVGEVSKDVGDYTAKVSLTQAGEKNYTLKSETSVYKITQEQISIAITPYSREYDNKDTANDGTLGKLQWTKTDGDWAADEEQPTITFTLKVSSAVNAGDYSVKGDCSDKKNYNVTFTGETDAIKITPRTLTVTAADKNSTYGDEPVALTYDVTGLVQGDGANPAIGITCAVTKTSGVNAEGYAIEVEVTNEQELSNYTVEKVNGKYTIDPKAVTVRIADQNDVFGFGKDYGWKPDLWTVDEQTPLADGESESILQVRLTKPVLTGAGTFEIDATYDNANYNVTFIKGTYKIDKLHVEHDGNETLFVLSVNGEEFNEENPELYKYNGEDALLSATVFVTEGNAPRALQVKLSQETISQPGVFEIVVTIDDVNYEGSHTFNVEFVRADGYSQRVHDALVALQQLVGDLSANTLTSSEEHFAIVNGIVEQFATLEEQDFVTYEQDLAKYVEIVDAWNNAADISPEVISTAKAIADAPIKWLVAVAAANALLAAMFVFGKGGLL